MYAMGDDQDPLYDDAAIADNQEHRESMYAGYEDAGGLGSNMLTIELYKPLGLTLKNIPSKLGITGTFISKVAPGGNAANTGITTKMLVVTLNGQVVDTAPSNEVAGKIRDLASPIHLGVVPITEW
jgi:hypothetical protein